jgi:hypothetical protein
MARSLRLSMTKRRMTNEILFPDYDLACCGGRLRVFCPEHS